MMALNLYSSRILLNTLGVTDYGINNVVGRIITTLAFLTNAMETASSRLIIYDFGTGDMDMMKRTFGNINNDSFYSCSFFLLFGEMIGFSIKYRYSQNG